MLVVCLVVEIIRPWYVAFADPLWSCINVKVIETRIRTCSVMPTFECHSLNTARDIVIIVQVTNLWSLRRSCELEWRARSSDWEKSISNFSRTTLTANLIGIAWTVSELFKHLLFWRLRSVRPWLKVKVNILVAVTAVPSFMMITIIVSEESLWRGHTHTHTRTHARTYAHTILFIYWRLTVQLSQPHRVTSGLLT